MQRVANHIAEFERYGFQVESASFNLREIKDVIQNPQQCVSGLSCHLDVSMLTQVDARVIEEFQHADHTIHGSTNLVAHPSYKFTLGAARLFRRDSRSLQLPAQFSGVEIKDKTQQRRAGDNSKEAQDVRPVSVKSCKIRCRQNPLNVQPENYRCRNRCGEQP